MTLNYVKPPMEGQINVCQQYVVVENYFDVHKKTRIAVHLRREKYRQLKSL